MSSSLRYQRIPPSADLADVVAYYWVVSGGGVFRAPTESQLVLPDGYTDLIFAADDAQSELRAMGLATAAITAPPRPLTLGVSFLPGRARALFETPAGELTDRLETFEALAGTPARQLLEALCAASSVPARVGLIEHFLRQHLRRPAVDPVASAAADAIVAQRGLVSLDVLSRAAGLGPRQLRRRFERAVGVGPKRFARVVRFSAVAGAVAAASGELEWPGLALDHGYADQAHMIREFAEFAGISPLRYWRRRRR